VSLVEVQGPDDGIATLVLARPEKRNALSMALRDEMMDALTVLGGLDALRVLVVTGAGEVFSAGFDLREFEQIGDAAFARAFAESSDRWHRAVLEFPLPTVAAVNGPALAGGFDLAVMCDLRVASETARFAHPEVSFSDVVYGPLRDAVGGGLARELALTGREVGAAEALRRGLVSAVVPREAVLDEARRWAEMVAVAPREVLVRTKAKVRRQAGVVLDDRLEL